MPTIVDNPQPPASTSSITTTDNKSSDAPKKPDRFDGLDVKVKSEFVLAERPSCLAPPVEAPKVEDDRDNNNNNKRDDRDNGKQSKRSRSNRGQNKKRPRDTRATFAEKACLAVVRGEPCPFEKSEKGCKYNHDLKEMLANRPADITEIDGGCPFWNMKGYCDFGIMCRLGSCHVNMSTGQNLCRKVDENGNETKELPNASTDEPKTTTNDDVKVEDEAPKNPEPGSTDDKSTLTTNNDVKMEDEALEKPEPGSTENPTTTTNGDTKVKDEAPKKPELIAVLGHHSEIKNVLSKKTQIELRKNKYPFVCKRHYEVPKGKKPPTDTGTKTPALELKERKLIDFRNKVYVAPLTTVGNLPFRRIMKQYGADITCGEMALSDQLLSGKPSEWALLKRHPCEDVFGVQIASGHADQFTRVAELLTNEESMEIDFVDLNLGCPIDMICEKGAGASLMLRERKLKASLVGILNVLQCPVTIKMRTGWNEKEPIAHQLVPKIQSWGIDGIGAVMIHGRSRLQRYSRVAKWDYIAKVASSQKPDLQQIPVIGNGDIFSYTDYEEKILNQINNGEEGDGGNASNLLPTAMLGRGALIKPWLPTEIKERRHWDISASERFDMLKDFVKFGLEHWGSDQQGLNQTRRFLLEWLSFLHRYVPVGLLEVTPQYMNQRPPNNMCGRSDLETMMMSKNCADWIKISEMLLGPVPEGFLFEPKHKANSY